MPLSTWGYTKHLQRHYDQRKRKEEGLLTAITTLQAPQINPTEIAQISDEALEGEDKALVRRIIQQFVVKIVKKEETGTLYYMFPFPNDLYMPSYGDLDLRSYIPKTRHTLFFEIPLPHSTVSDHLHTDKNALHNCIVALRAKGLSYREIAHETGLHWTRIGQILKFTAANPDHKPS
jgi:hypothetical protein